MRRWTLGIGIVGIVATVAFAAWTAAAPEPSPAGEEVRDTLLARFAFAQYEGEAQLRYALANNPDDPAYDEYQKARRALNSARYRNASQLMLEIRERWPQSLYADDALYWAAFARYRLAERDEDRGDFEHALELLELLRNEYAESDILRDADDLSARITARLAELGDARSAERVRERADRDDDVELRMIALDALLQMDNDAAVPILRSVLLENRETNNAEMRAKAVFILSQHSGDETTDILLDVARNDPDSEVRLNAVFWLSQVDDERAVDALVDVLAHADDEEMQEKAIFALSQHESERAARALREFASDPSKPSELRENAIFWLGQQGSNFEFLSQLYHDLDSRELKEKVIFGISQNSSRRNSDWLFERVHDRNESTDMRKLALFWLGQQSKIPCSELARLIDEFQDEEMLGQIVFLLGQRRDDDCVEALIDIARSTRDVELRKTAIFWLGQTKHRAALQYLQELIEQ